MENGQTALIPMFSNLYLKAKSIANRASFIQLSPTQFGDAHAHYRIIHKLISKEAQFIRDIDLIESVSINSSLDVSNKTYMRCVDLHQASPTSLSSYHYVPRAGWILGGRLWESSRRPGI